MKDFFVYVNNTKDAKKVVDFIVECKDTISSLHGNSSDIYYGCINNKGVCHYSDVVKREYPDIPIITLEELFNKKIDYEIY